MTAIDAASLGTRISIVSLLSFMMLNKTLLGELPSNFLRPGLFPVFMMLLVIGSIVLPAHRGKLLFSSLGRVLFAPFYPVTLWDSFVADVLTSLVKPMTDFAYSICYVLSFEWNLPYSHQVLHHADSCMRAYHGSSVKV